jgi:hypothetical protein
MCKLAEGQGMAKTRRGMVSAWLSVAGLGRQRARRLSRRRAQRSEGAGWWRPAPGRVRLAARPSVSRAKGAEGWEKRAGGAMKKSERHDDLLGFATVGVAQQAHAPERGGRVSQHSSDATCRAR